jgi:bacteriorhodopsin
VCTISINTESDYYWTVSAVFVAGWLLVATERRISVSASIFRIL